MRMYLLFEFLSIFSMNMTSFFRIKLFSDYVDQMSAPVVDMDDMDGTNLFDIANWIIVNDGVVDLSLSMRKSFIFLVIFDAYNILCKPFEFQEYAAVKNICQRYAVAIFLCCLFHSIGIGQLLIISVTDITKLAVIRVARSDGVKIASHVFVSLFQTILVAASVKVCADIKKGLDDNNNMGNQFGTGSRLITLYRMSRILTGLVALMAVANLAIKITRFQEMSWTAEAWVEMGKATFDSLIGIVIIGLFFVLFPRLRPGFKDDKRERVSEREAQNRQ